MSVRGDDANKAGRSGWGWGWGRNGDAVGGRGGVTAGVIPLLRSVCAGSACVFPARGRRVRLLLLGRSIRCRSVRGVFRRRRPAARRRACRSNAAHPQRTTLAEFPDVLIATSTSPRFPALCPACEDLVIAVVVGDACEVPGVGARDRGHRRAIRLTRRGFSEPAGEFLAEVHRVGRGSAVAARQDFAAACEHAVKQVGCIIYTCEVCRVVRKR